MTDLALSKWYLDCVTDSGHAVIVYWAELRWRGLVFHYESLLEHSPSGGTGTRSSLRKNSSPQVRGKTISWESPSLEVRGSWSALAGELGQTILDSAQGRVDWRCLQPRAHAELLIQGSRPLRGLGYVEHLTLTVLPWRMPVRELRWGRFLTETDSLIWIDWSGPRSRRLVFYNGSPVESAGLSESEIRLEDAGLILHIDDRNVLRDTTLGKSVLSVMPQLRKIVPGRVLGIRECKWLSRATLRRPGGAETKGWAIHEIVQWP